MIVFSLNFSSKNLIFIDSSLVTSHFAQGKLRHPSSKVCFSSDFSMISGFIIIIVG